MVGLVRQLSLCAWLAAWAVALGGATCGAKGVEELPTGKASAADVLAPGDEVEVIVFGEPDLSGKQRIRSSGTIRLPLVGSMQAAGLTSDELAMRIESAYNERYLRNAEVTINVLSSTANNVFVLGSVKQPGPYPMTGRMTLINALARAGGATQLADESRVQITRTVDSKQTFVVVNAGEVRRGELDDIELLPGDVVFVPESPL